MWQALTVLEVDDAAFSVGGMAAVSTLVGDLLSGGILRDDVGLVDDLLGRGPDGLPWLSWGHCIGNDLK